jgi:hypothetical protein
MGGLGAAAGSVSALPPQTGVSAGPGTSGGLAIYCLLTLPGVLTLRWVPGSVFLRPPNFPSCVEVPRYAQLGSLFFSGPLHSPQFSHVLGTAPRCSRFARVQLWKPPIASSPRSAALCLFLVLPPLMVPIQAHSAGLRSPDPCPSVVYIFPALLIHWPLTLS